MAIVYFVVGGWLGFSIGVWLGYHYRTFLIRRIDTLERENADLRGALEEDEHAGLADWWRNGAEEYQ